MEKMGSKWDGGYLVFYNLADGVELIRFAASAVTIAGVSLSVDPDTLATLTGEQILTNKTIKAPVITPANGTQAALIADIANDANGTAIATAVNAILAAIKGAGIIASA